MSRRTAFAPGAARRTRTTPALTRDPDTDRIRRAPRPTARRQSTRRAAVLAAIRNEEI